MNVTCEHCKAISYVPDDVIPESGITIECPECEKHIFIQNTNTNLSFDDIGIEENLSLDTSHESYDLNLNFENEKNSEEASLDLNMDVEEESGFSGLSALDSSDSQLNKISMANISQSMIIDKNKLKNEKKSRIREVAPEKQNNFIETEDPNEKKSQLESYLKYKEVSLTKKKSSKTPIIIGAVVLALIGVGVFFFLNTKKTKQTTAKSLGLTPVFEKMLLDNPSNYKETLNIIKTKITKQPNEIVLKAAYVYVASKYYISTGFKIKSFAPTYDSYASVIKRFPKNKFIVKALIYYDAVKLIDKKRKSFSIKQRFSQLNNPVDSLFLKSFILSLENKPDIIKNLIDNSKLTPKEKLASKVILLNSLFKNSQNISTDFKEIISINPRHIKARLIHLQYLLNYNQNDKIEKELKKMDNLMKFANLYEKNSYIMFKIDFEEKRTNIEAAHKAISLITHTKIDSYKTFKYIIEFDYRNFYNKDALALLRKLYPKYSKKLHISKRYIEFLIRENNYTKAGDISINLREKNPNNSEVYYLSGLLSNSLGNNVEAKKYLEKAIDLNPKNEDAIILLAKLYVKMKKDKKAIVFLENKLKELKTSNKVSLGLALLYYKLENYNKAKELLKKLVAVKENNTNIIADFKLSMIEYHQTKKVNYTLNKLNSIYSRFPNLGVLRIDIAKLEIENKNYTRAIELLKKDLKIRKELDAYLYLGIAYYYTDKFKLGIKSIEKVISMDSTNGKAYYYLGELFKKKNYMNKAMNAYESAIKYEPTNTEFLYTVAREQVILKQYDSAFENYMKLVKLDPSFNSNYELGSLFLEKGDITNAMKYLNKASKFTNNSDSSKLVDLSLKMGDIFFKKKQYKLSIVQYKKAISMNSDYAEAYYKLAELYRIQNKFKKAAKNYDKARRKDPLQGKYYYQLGYLYKGMKRYKKAQMIFKLYLKNIPNTPDKSEIQDEILDLKGL